MRKIYAPDTDNQAVYRVTQKITNEDWKFGYIDKYGRQWLDCVYDEIIDLSSACKLIRQGKLYGMATYSEGVFIPLKFRKGAINQYIESGVMTVDKHVFPRRVVQVKYRGKYYYLDHDGNMYPQVRKFLAFPRIDTSTCLDVHQIEPDVD